MVRENKVIQPVFAPHPYANGLWGNTFGNNNGNVMYKNLQYAPNRNNYSGRRQDVNMDGGAIPVAKGIRKFGGQSVRTDEREGDVNVPSIGVNTIKSSLRNTSHDIRSKKHPEFTPSPWLQSSIEPDHNLTSSSYVPKGITPGLNLSSTGLEVSGEFRPMPRTVDELRPSNNQKVKYETETETDMLWSDLENSCKLVPNYETRKESCGLDMDDMDDMFNMHAMNDEDEDEYESESESESEENLDLDEKYPPRPSSKSKSTTASLSQQDDVIMSSHAASVKYGKHIQVNSAETGIVYDYDKSCARCVVGLSVSDKLEFYPEPDMQELIEDSKEIIQEYLEKKYVQVLEKTYDLGDCCICLDEDPDTVFYQCGHKCIHISCIDKDISKCPVCRTRISAYLKLNKINPDTIVVGVIDEAELEFESESENNDKEFTDNDIDIGEDHDEIPEDIKDKVVVINA